MPGQHIVIFTALPFEARAIAQAFGVHKLADGPTPLPSHNGSVELHIIGLRAGRMPALKPDISHIIMAGLAGALDPKLLAGDVIVEGFSPPAGCSSGVIWTSDQILLTPMEKSAAYKKTASAAVDMETATVRSRASQINAKLICVRGISDTAGDALDADILNWIGPDGNAKPSRIAIGILKRPSKIPALIKLGNQSKLAMQKVGIATLEIVKAIQQEK